MHKVIISHADNYRLEYVKENLLAALQNFLGYVYKAELGSVALAKVLSA